MALPYTVQELCALQDKHSNRPDVFDDVEEEQEIEILTQEISQVNTKWHHLTHLLIRDDIKDTS